MKNSHQHIPVRKLTEYLTGELSLLKRVDVESHMAVCTRCARQLAELERLITRIRAAASQDAPSSIIDRAVRMFRSKKTRLPTASDSIRRVLAMLQFDSAMLASAFGVRSGKPGARQLLFSTDTDEIDLRIEPAKQAWTLSGQILGKSPAEGRAVLEGAVGKSEAPINEQSEFVFTPVQTGMYRLILKLTKTEIEIKDVRVGS